MPFFARSLKGVFKNVRSCLRNGTLAAFFFGCLIFLIGADSVRACFCLFKNLFVFQSVRPWEGLFVYTLYDEYDI